MAEPTIQCPHCQTEIKLTESLARPLIEATRRDFEKKLAEKDAALVAQAASLRERETLLVREKEKLEERIAHQLEVQRPLLAAEEAKKARLAVAVDLQQKQAENAALQRANEEQRAKLAEAQQAQAALIKKERELEDARRSMELTVQKRVEGELATVRERALREAQERMGLKLAEKDQTLSAMQKQIEELKRKSEQGSQQLQGEVLEVRLESLLHEKFPIDSIARVAKGENGGDVLQQVVGPTGKICGSILWETKRTKNWSDAWLGKLRDDQRAAKADIAILVSQTLPKDVETFDFSEGIWICDLRCIVPVAIALRHSLIEVASARQALEGQQTKMEMVYQYLTGPRFRQRVQAIIEKFTDMHQDLDKERKTLTRLWAKREEQIRSVLETTSCLYGDLQGIAGQSLKELEGLNLLTGTEQPDALAPRASSLF